ncbi:MAG TPA: hypothetical protein VGE07_27545 [Herpetosiphonaceae bacterium]
MDDLNELTLVPTETVWARYDDLVIDGRSLAAYLWPDQPPWTTHISPFGWPRVGGPAVAHHAAAELLRKTPGTLAAGRRPLYVCNDCGHVGCGAITAVVERVGGVIIWRAFGFEANHDPGSLPERWFPQVPAFQFAVQPYYALFAPYLRGARSG